MKYAVRIISGETGESSLFAVCCDDSGQKGGELVRHYNLAKKTIPLLSSDWVSIDEWCLAPTPPATYWDFPAGNLFN